MNDSPCTYVVWRRQPDGRIAHIQMRKPDPFHPVMPGLLSQGWRAFDAEPTGVICLPGELTPEEVVLVLRSVEGTIHRETNQPDDWDDCKTVVETRRVCEKGTLGCVVHHDGWVSTGGHRG